MSAEPTTPTREDKDTVKAEEEVSTPPYALMMRCIFGTDRFRSGQL
jgi:hypothetical protein